MPLFYLCEVQEQPTEDDVSQDGQDIQELFLRALQNQVYGVSQGGSVKNGFLGLLN